MSCLRLQLINQSKNRFVINKLSSSTMSDHEQDQFQTGNAGSSDTTPCQAGSIKKGGYMMIKGFPCKVTEYSTAKPGKHGASKATIVGVDIFSNKKYEDTAPTSATVFMPNISRTQYEVADIDEDEFVSIILKNGDLKRDLKLPAEDPEVYKELKKAWDENHEKNSIYFTALSAIGTEKFVSCRVKAEED